MSTNVKMRRYATLATVVAAVVGVASTPAGQDWLERYAGGQVRFSVTLAAPGKGPLPTTTEAKIAYTTMSGQHSADWTSAGRTSGVWQSPFYAYANGDQADLAVLVEGVPVGTLVTCQIDVTNHPAADRWTVSAATGGTFVVMCGYPVRPVRLPR